MSCSSYSFPLFSLSASISLPRCTHFLRHRLPEALHIELGCPVRSVTVGFPSVAAATFAFPFIGAAAEAVPAPTLELPLTFPAARPTKSRSKSSPTSSVEPSFSAARPNEARAARSLPHPQSSVQSRRPNRTNGGDANRQTRKDPVYPSVRAA